MRLKIGARKSDLARLQAYLVGEALTTALKKTVPGLQIDYTFRESLGDKNLTDPLWKMPEKGVFTQDFYEDLMNGTFDLVVHSWKDLPVASTNGTYIAATLPRADKRDLLLIRKDRWAKHNGTLKILSSSPRRAYNLENFLPEALPKGVRSVQFEPVRGNVPTRVRKLLEQDVDGLIVAKAAMDRLLDAEREEFSTARRDLRAAIEKCHWMALPLLANPAAAAQGALAIEIKTGREDLRAILEKINHRATFECVEEERRILASHGGGCHQKIGVTVLKRHFGQVTICRGVTDAGQILEVKQLLRPSEKFAEKNTVSEDRAWPLKPSDAILFERKPLKVEPTNDRFLWLARDFALPENWKPSLETTVWTSGLKTWKKLAARGVWVNGSNEGFGEADPTRAETLVDQKKISWLKLTHTGGYPREGVRNMATYELVPKSHGSALEGSALEGKTHFFWMSGSAFQEALKRKPELADGHHACGPGNTAELIRSALGPGGRVAVFLDQENWLDEVVVK